ncbi:hypothetical protein [Methylomonas sp. AM2-LC]|uniref:hypothetical protein n=1 Tax=Methylomonas sp. AM2-LC TaxID=3153301 RepID=UPI003263BEA2
MVRITSRFPQDTDIVYLAENLRQADIAELAAVTDLLPCEAVIASVQASDPRFLRAWLADDELLCICGCSPVTVAQAAPWLLATDLLDKHLLRLTREARQGVQDMRSVYPHLTNVIDVKQVKIMRWLQLLGFAFTDRQEARAGFEVMRFEMSSVFSVSAVEKKAT